MFKRIAVFGFGVISYLVFFATFLYAIGFVGNILVPKSIDAVPQVPFIQALVTNAILLGIFAISHSVMARPFFKRWVTKYIPKAAERSLYVLVASVVLITMFAFWEPMGGVIWQIDGSVGQALMNAAFVFGWALVLVSTLAINHFDLFGLRQVWLELRGKEYKPLQFKTPALYRVVRHPLYVGWFFAFWATPTMTAAHLVFAVLASAYILIAIKFEERDLAQMHPEYASYKRKVPMLIPRVFGKNGGQRPATEAA